ncbi:MAG TPA: hypothetical protein PKA13_14360 [Geminicoccaceae bacterium]|nr:hypothetical protein [Geminicoccus sp.]HMU50953.1 hypothetical protein [Geminicoccaceae bacterium]
MTPNMFRFIDAFVRRLRSWPRRLVLRETGEPVVLIELHDSAGRRRCLVELRGGRRVMVTEAELDSELAMRGVAVAVCVGLALAGVLVGGSLGLGQDEGPMADLAACAQAVRQAGDLYLR